MFTDWDGTVTLQDSNDFMTDNLGFGNDERKRVMKLMLDEKLSFREGFNEMLTSISKNGHGLNECIDLLLQNIKLDPGFESFLRWCKASRIPIYVISSGMKPIINALLEKLIGNDVADYVKIIANDVAIGEGNSWHIIYRDETPYGHDKSRSIKKIMEGFKDDEPKAFYCGDGVSDLSASKTCDILFARNGCALTTYCDRNKIPYQPFNTFYDIKSKINEMI